MFTCDAGRHEASDVAGDHGPQDEARQVRLAVRRHGPQAAQLDAHGAQVGETTQCICGYQLGTCLEQTIGWVDSG